LSSCLKVTAKRVSCESPRKRQAADDIFLLVGGSKKSIHLGRDTLPPGCFLEVLILKDFKSLFPEVLILRDFKSFAPEVLILVDFKAMRMNALRDIFGVL
jgi:hypothetical protein